MKKRRYTSLLLALLLLLETVAATAYAKEAETPEMPYYVAIGDSIASGYGLRGNEPKRLFVQDTKNNFHCHTQYPKCNPQD